MRKSDSLPARFEARMGVHSRAERVWFWLTFALLILYVEAVVLIQDLDKDAVSAGRLVLHALIIPPLCLGGVLLCRRARFGPGRAAPTGKKTTVLFLGVFAVTLAWCLLWLRAYWPGCFSLDSWMQLDQVILGQYDNWHPALHTWIFFTLPYKLFGTTTACVVLQMVLFSLAAAYLASVLYRDRCPWLFLVLGLVYILADPNVMQVMLYPRKDGAMGIFSLVVFSQLIQIFASGGGWLKKWYNAAGFALALFLTNAMRHNAVLLVAPLLVVLIVLMKNIRRPLLAVTAVVLLATVLLQGPVFAAAKVAKPGERVVETMGLPLTVLCRAYANDAESLPQEVRDFVGPLGSDTDWAYFRVLDRAAFNFIKWNSQQPIAEPIEAAGRGKILGYMVQAFRSTPYAAQALKRLTEMVWSIDGYLPYTIGVEMFPNLFPECPDVQLEKDPALAPALDAYSGFCQSSPLKYAFCLTGVVLLVMLTAAVSSVGGGLERAFLVLAPLAYNFGTMLLLSGDDFRFFHYNFLILVPLLYLFLRKRGDAEDEA